MGYNVDEYLIIKGPQQDCADDLAAFEALAAQWWPTQGYPVVDGGVVPRNAATGELDYEAQRTVAWDVLKQAPDGEYWWWSPSDDARFVDWKEYLAQTGYTLKCVEVEKDWEEEGDEEI